MIFEFLNYIKTEKRYSPHTYTAYKKDLQQYSLYLSETYNIDDTTKINFQIIRSWLTHLAENKISNRSIARKLASVKSYYKYLHHKQIIPLNPASKLKMPKVKKSLPIFASESSMVTILDKIDYETNFSGMRDQLLLELLYGTGIRLSECIELKERNVDFQAGTIKVKGKGNKERIVPMHAHLKDAIQKYINEKKLVFSNNPSDELLVTNDGKKMYPMFVYRVVKKYLSAVPNLEKKSPHVLRHTFATHLLNRGAGLNAIKELLGHNSLAATQVYTHNSPEKLKAIYKMAHPKS
ncbi:MAG: tyrosine-type recombinase/integrase [Cytophagaceae bacterium]|nr:tyrosine-type recombinase/integrase [Cytophagaceae bacterium]MDW8456173.1 tyrosine-type recombinase/integrase [Cytophagaceae bacterium]